MSIAGRVVTRQFLVRRTTPARSIGRLKVPVRHGPQWEWSRATMYEPTFAGFRLFFHLHLKSCDVRSSSHELLGSTAASSYSTGSMEGLLTSHAIQRNLVTISLSPSFRLRSRQLS